MKTHHIKRTLGAAALSAVMSFSVIGGSVFTLPVTAAAAETSASTAKAEKLAAPKGFSYQANTNEVRLSWKAVKGAAAYKVSIYDAESGKFKTYKTTKTTNCSIKDLKKNTTYKFKVTTMIQNGKKYVAQKTSGAIKCKTASKDKNGWYKKGDSKIYYENGFQVKSSAKKIDGKLYLFGKTGAQLKNGIYTVGDNMYSVDKNGIVACNKWISTNNKDKQYYAGKDGKLTCYEVTDEYLYINGKIALTDDIIPKRTAYTIIRINKTYYQFITYHDYVHPNNEDYAAKGLDVYDVLTCKKIGYIYGEYSSASNGKLTGGTLLNHDTNELMTMKAGQASITAVSSPIVVYKAECADGVGDTVNARINIINTSGKKINNIIYKTYVKDKTGKVLSCTAEGDTEQNLNMPTAVPAGETNETFWRKFMTNANADSLEIDQVTITYSDGTTQTLSASNINFVC